MAEPVSLAELIQSEVRVVYGAQAHNGPESEALTSQVIGQVDVLINKACARRYCREHTGNAKSNFRNRRK
jgi:hypothetical protein